MRIVADLETNSLEASCVASWWGGPPLRTKCHHLPEELDSAMLALESARNRGVPLMVDGTVSSVPSRMENSCLLSALHEMPSPHPRFQPVTGQWTTGPGKWLIASTEPKPGPLSHFADVAWPSFSQLLLPPAAEGLSGWFLKRGDGRHAEGRASTDGSCPVWSGPHSRPSSRWAIPANCPLLLPKCRVDPSIRQRSGRRC